MLCLLYTMYIQISVFMDPELKSKLDYMTSVALANAKKTSQRKFGQDWKECWWFGFCFKS